MILVEFIIENFDVMALLVIFGVTFVVFLTKKGEIEKKAANSKSIEFTDNEYKTNREIASLVLTNTTVSFTEKDFEERDNKKNLYYRTIFVGEQNIKLDSFRMSDVGEI